MFDVVIKEQKDEAAVDAISNAIIEAIKSLNGVATVELVDNAIEEVEPEESED